MYFHSIYIYILGEGVRGHNEILPFRLYQTPSQFVKTCIFCLRFNEIWPFLISQFGAVAKRALKMQPPPQTKMFKIDKMFMCFL